MLPMMLIGLILAVVIIVDVLAMEVVKKVVDKYKSGRTCRIKMECLAFKTLYST
jgi:hypothetical protein